MLIWRDVDPVHPHLSVFNSCVGVSNLNLSLSQAFDLGSLEDDSGFKGLQEIVVVSCLPVGGDQASARAIFLIGCLLLLFILAR